MNDETTLLDTLTPDSSVRIVLTQTAADSYVLQWDDGVANEWVETYNDAAIAFARVAVLLRAVATDRLFCHQPTDDEAGSPEFVTDADGFLNAQLN